MRRSSKSAGGTPSAGLRRSVVRWSIAAALAAPSVVAQAQVGRTGALRATETTAVAVEREDVSLDCVEGDAPDALRCALHVEWTLRNPTAEATTASVVLTWPHDEPPVVRANGGPLPEAPTLRPARLLVAPDGVVSLTLDATLVLDTPFLADGDQPSPLTPVDGLHARHPLLSSAWESARRGLPWARPDDLRFASVGPTTVRTRVPAAWHASAMLREGGEGDGRDGDGGAATRAASYTSPTEDPPHRLGVAWSRGERGTVLRHGGPFLALGGGLHATPSSIPEGFRARVGYELGVVDLVAMSVSAETDFRSQAVVTPLVEVVSWGMLVVPSLSLGLGAPIQLAPSPRPGLRVHASATLYAVGFDASIDVWPDDGTAQVLLMGRVGL